MGSFCAQNEIPDGNIRKLKGKGFILIFSPRVGESLMGVAACLVLCSLVLIVKLLNRGEERGVLKVDIDPGRM